MYIGIDHGYYAIKTWYFSFPAGITAYSHEPYTLQNTLEYGGKFFVCGTGRQPILRNKVESENYCLMTLAAIAKEIQQRGTKPECSVTIAVGLPLARFGREKKSFREYLRPFSQPVSSKFEGIPHKVTIEDVKLFPQGYSALMIHPELLQNEPSVLLMDIGGWTVDLMRLDNNVPNAATCRSLELGMIRCIDEVKEQVRRDVGLSVTDAQVERVLAGKPCSMDEDARSIIQKQGRLYTERLLSAAMEAGFDLKAIPVVMLGGSAAMVSTTSHKSVQQLVAHFGGMFELCRKKKIDLILTKSISRFARNTLDCIKHVRILKSWGIPVIFEKENIDTSNMNSEMILTCLSSFAQAESESISGNVTKGIRMGYRQGRFSFRYKNFLGYRKGPDGEPEIVPEEAKIIRLIAQNYLNGDSLRTIKETLESMGIPTATGNQNWSTEAIQRILQNEKYMGDVLLQKTYTADFIEGKIKKNNGELPQYYIKDNHPAIIPREMFYQIQEEIARRKSKMPANAKKAKTNRGRFTSKYALSERLVCRDCGSYFRRVTWNIHGRKQIVWRCINRLEFGPKSCGNSPSLNETSLHAGGHPFPGSRMQGHLEEMASPPAGCTYTLHRWRKCHNQSSCDRKQTP